MPSDFPVYYMLIMMVLTVGIIFILGAMQKAVLKELKDVLYIRKNPELYIKMLRSKKLCLVLRKGTIELLRLDGYLYKGDENGVIASINALDKLYLKPAEKLDFLQKRLSFFVINGNEDKAEETLSIIEQLLKNEKNAHLKAVLHDAEQLVAVYIYHETSLIDDLLKKEIKQNGNAKGITEYMLAKLYWYSGNHEKSDFYLKLADKNLKGTVWHNHIKAAVKNKKLLEVQ